VANFTDAVQLLHGIALCLGINKHRARNILIMAPAALRGHYYYNTTIPALFFLVWEHFLVVIKFYLDFSWPPEATNCHAPVAFAP